MKQFLRWIPSWVTTVLVFSIITYLSLAAKPLGEMSISLFKGADKVVHLLMYMCLAIVMLLDYSKFRYPHHAKLNVCFALMSFASLYGLIMELAQLVLRNGRGYDIYDWIADTIGVIIGFIVARGWLMRAFRHYALHHSHHHHHHHHHHEEEQPTKS